MTPEQALAYISTIARNAVLVAHTGAPASGLTFEDHARLAQAEGVLREAIAPKQEAENVPTQEGEGHAGTGEG